MTPELSPVGHSFPRPGRYKWHPVTGWTLYVKTREKKDDVEAEKVASK